MTPYAEVVGDPIAQSKSPAIHRFWLETLGLDGDYLARRLPTEALADYLADKRADPDWRGCNVTIPHKQAMLPLLDRVDRQAERIGAVNIIVREGDALVGYNSDAPGFLAPLRPLLDGRHLLRTARVFGTGGAARAVANALWDEGFTLIVIGRDVAKAHAIIAPFGGRDAHVAPLADFAAPLAFDWGDCEGRLDLIVNTTSCGMDGRQPLPLDLSHAPPGAIVYDAVYSPLETPLLAAARAAGHPVIDGLEMLIGQAREAFRRFFGIAPPDDPASNARLRALLTA